MFFEPLSKCYRGLSYILLITLHPTTFVAVDDPILLQHRIFVYIRFLVGILLSGILVVVLLLAWFTHLYLHPIQYPYGVFTVHQYF